MGQTKFATVWFTGLSGSGKSTIATNLAQLLSKQGTSFLALDGDDLREGLNSDLGFRAEDRAENVRRLGEVALLFARNVGLSVVTAISPYESDRQQVRARHEESGVGFIEAYVATPLAVCEQRDVKGLYARARAGTIECFTGVSDPYEVPAHPELTLFTEGRSPLLCAERVRGYLTENSWLHDESHR